MARKPTHGSYCFLRRSATAFPPRFHRTNFSNFCRDRERLGPLPTASLLRDRHHLFPGGNLDNGHWSRFHRFFSHAAWDLEILSLHLAHLVVRVLAPGASLSWAVDDTLCRKRGLNVYGAGMHYDPLISSRAKPLVSWGHDWVVLCLIIAHPFWAPTNIFALPISMRLDRYRQGLTLGKKGKSKTTTPSLQGRPQPSHPSRTLAVELISLVATWFPSTPNPLLRGDKRLTAAIAFCPTSRPTFT